jgi:hypothetical protein
VNCQNCGQPLDITALEVRKDSIVDQGSRTGEPEIEVGLRCECGADYAYFVGVRNLVLMD